MTVIDLYAGPGGWDEGMRLIGITDVIGIEIEPNACSTAFAAGHVRIQQDVAALTPTAFGQVSGLVASPPCQAWSMAGKRAGELDRVKVHALIDAYAAGSDDIGTGWADERSHHAAQPIRWVRDLRPTWVCFEQVPPVLGLWQHASGVLRRWGYSTWTGVLNSADYGVPQTRERAVLMARLDAPVHPPVPTHAKNPGGEDLFGGQLLPWVSMADALGWGMTLRPSMTVTGGGSATGGADTFGNGARKGMVRELRSGQWVQRSNYSAGGGAEGATAEDRGRTIRALDDPSVTITGKGFQWVLHTNRDQRLDGTRQTVDPHTNPAPTLTGKSGGQWALKRPATTVAGDPRISAPGHRDHAGGERQHEQSIRVTVAEAAVLQSFPADYPWQGTKTAQFLQVGNAVPPRLAAAIVSAVTS